MARCVKISVGSSVRMAVMRIWVVRVGVGHGFVLMPMRMLPLNLACMVVQVMRALQATPGWKGIFPGAIDILKTCLEFVQSCRFQL